MQDDGHIFCLPAQIAGEIRSALDLVEEIMGAFGFNEYEVDELLRRLNGWYELLPQQRLTLLPAHLLRWTFQLDQTNLLEAMRYGKMPRQH